MGIPIQQRSFWWEFRRVRWAADLCWCQASIRQGGAGWVFWLQGLAFAYEDPAELEFWQVLQLSDETVFLEST